MRRHHERHARGDRGAERRQVLAEQLLRRAGEADRRVVGVLGRGAEAGEVLGGGGDVGAAVALDRRAGERRDLLGVAGEGAAAHHRAAGDVGDRREVDVDARGAQVVRRGAGVGAGALRRRRGGLAFDGRRPREVADLAALLVGGDERRAARRALQPGGEARERRLRGDVVLEQDHARGAARLQRLRDVGGRPGAGEAHDDELPDLAAERELARLLHRRRRRGRARGRGAGAGLWVVVAGADGDADHERERGGDHEGQPPPPGLGRHPESSRSAWPAASPSSVMTSRSTRLSTSQRWW